MTPELHQRMRKLFEDALLRPDDQRQAFLEAECQGNPQLVEAITRLLAAHAESGQFLSRRNDSKRYGRYVVSREIGRGAMGVVYEAADPLIGRRVALKVLRIDSLESPNLQFLTDSLFREAQSGGMLSHSGIVTVFDVGQEGNEAFIAMELVEGQTVQNVLSATPGWESTRALDVLKQSAAALDYAHQRGVVHRDIKPANIMLDRHNMVKIADFGIARITTSALQTVTAVVLGTPTYMSPEQIQMRPLNGRSDQFSLAVVAFQLLTSTVPFRADSMAGLAHQIVYDEAPSASARNPALPPAVDKTLRRGLAKEPANRYDSCSEFVSALDLALRESPKKPRSRKIFYLLGSGVAAAMLLGGLMVYRSRTPKLHPGSLQAQAPAAVPKTAAPNSTEASHTPKPPAGELPPKPAPTDPSQLGKMFYAEAVAARDAGLAEEMALLEKAAKLGNLDAMVELGQILMDKHPEGALQWFRKAADKGNTKAMVLTGFIYSQGLGVTKQSDRAMYWYELAAKGGDGQAMYNLANMYVLGDGTKKDLAKAKQYFQSAADHGAAGAKERVAELEHMGKLR